jgi:hypothetical protein
LYKLYLTHEVEHNKVENNGAKEEIGKGTVCAQFAPFEFIVEWVHLYSECNYIVVHVSMVVNWCACMRVRVCVLWCTRVCARVVVACGVCARCACACMCVWLRVHVRVHVVCEGEV